MINYQQLVRHLLKYSNRKILIASTGTDIGKTFVAVKVIENFLANNLKLDVIKPIASGVDLSTIAGLANSDSGKILASLKRGVTLDSIREISPWCFKEPVSPHLAASLNGVEITLQELSQFIDNRFILASNNGRQLIVESAGGIASPINRHHNFLDLAKQNKMPVILVVGNYLGSISHIVTMLWAIAYYEVEVVSLLINSNRNQEISHQNSQISSTDLLRFLQDFVDSHQQLKAFFKDCLYCCN